MCLKCYEEHQLLIKTVNEVNEGGPFGTPMRKLVEFLRLHIENKALHPIDKMRIE